MKYLTEIYLPEYIEDILNVLNENGYAAYVVGGCVRDALLGIEPKDYDICTSATPDEIHDIFENDNYAKDYEVIDYAEKYGTTTLHHIQTEHNIEITTFRVDGEYDDCRHPDTVEFTTDFTKDIMRRDFTINAIAYNPTIGLIDLVDGQKDLLDGIIRSIAVPDKCLSSDELRVFRAIRFASKYNFTIEQDLLKEISYAKFQHVSCERIISELKQIFENFNGIDKKKWPYVKNSPEHQKIELASAIEPVIDAYICPNGYNLMRDDGSFISHDHIRTLLRAALLTNASFNVKLWLMLHVAYGNAQLSLFKLEQWLRSHKYPVNTIKSIINFEKICNALTNTKIPDAKHFIRLLLYKYPYEDVIAFSETFYEYNATINPIISKELVEDIYTTQPTRLDQLMLSTDQICAYANQYLNEPLVGKAIGDCLKFVMLQVLNNPDANTKTGIYNIINCFTHLSPNQLYNELHKYNI